MGTKYTYDGTTTTSSAGFTTLELTGSTLANYAYVDEDPYLRVLRVSGANAVLNDVTIASGGTLFASGKATVNNLVLSGTTSNTSANFTSVNGLGGACGVQCAEDKVASFGGGDCSADGFKVAHFADENRVRVLTQRTADGVCKRRHVVVDFALRYNALLVRVVEFDWVFNRDDVVSLLAVDDVNH